MHDSYQKIIQCMLDSDRIVITGHQSPDGDSIGSSLGLYRFLKKLGKEVTICHPDSIPSVFLWLEDIDQVIFCENKPLVVQEKIEQADLLICLDYNSFSRVGEKMQSMLEQFNQQIILIDHHINPTICANLSLCDPTCCSTSQLIYEVIRYSDQKSVLDAYIVSPLYMGMVTDTGSFRYDSVSAKTHLYVSEMLELGVKHHVIHERIFDNTTIDKLNLWAYATSEKLQIVYHKKIALISLTKKELNRFNFQRGDTEGLVNLVLSIYGIKVAVLLTEQHKTIRLSFRSKEDWMVNELAREHFSGGGHKFASGGISLLSMNDTIRHLKQQFTTYFPLD